MTTQPEPLTDHQLDEIETRARDYAEGHAHFRTLCGPACDMATAAPALIAEVRHLRDRVAELEAYAYGCDGEGCVLPHSSWCELAKKTAAANQGCTCPRPWEGHPQPHAGYCWLVSPPRAEVEEMRKRIAELTAGSNR